ncbi:S-layer homology domain-containing protein [Priestia filamentosa]|uniref:C40 family peptidase n=1 Tax=Priestia filamentosa TaxID=1402861 RepID=UPI001FB27258|nr:C40 family peptidase [Priestia filamentosa]UOE60787.1 S-layer homology domain-containing protein [Priestia filamentosa]
MIRRVTLTLISCFVLLLSGLLLEPSSSAKAANLTNYDKLLPAAYKYMGVPYRYGGTTASGFDCSGYVRQVYSEVGISLPRTAAQMYGQGTAVSKSNLRVGDLVFFNTSGKGVSHVGIYVGNNEFINAASSKGVSIAKVNDPYYWGSRYVGAKRIFSTGSAKGNFRDTQNSWIAKDVNALANKDIVIGYSNNYYRPNENISRAQTATILANTLDLKMTNRKQPFKDVTTSSWSVGAVNAVKSAGIFEGNNGYFMPDKALTRAQMAAVLTDAFDLKANSSYTFKDVPKNNWAAADISALAAAGITTGYDDGTFKPNEPVTRAQMAAFVNRAVNR